MSLTAAFWPSVSGPLRSALSTARARIGARVRPPPACTSAMVSRSSATARSVVSSPTIAGIRAPWSDPAASRPATAASASPTVTSPRVPGERGREQVRAREHRLALREMRDGPGNRFMGRRWRRRAFVPAAFGRQRFLAFRPGGAGGPGPNIGSRLAFPRPPARRPSPRPRRPAPSHRSRDRRPGAATPHLELVAVDVALRGAAHQRRALGKPRIVPRRPHAALGHARLDLGAPGREGVDGLARHARDLEPAVAVGLLDSVAQPSEPARELAAVDGPDQHLRGVELLVGHGAPLAVLALDHVGDDGVRVELRVEIARGVVAEGGRDHPLPAGAHQPSRRRGLPRTRSGVLHPGLDRVLLDPGKRCRDRPVVRVDDAAVAADERGQRDRLRGREGDVAARPVHELPVRVAAPELAPGGRRAPCLRARRGRRPGPRRHRARAPRRPFPAQALASRWAGSSLA